VVSLTGNGALTGEGALTGGDALADRVKNESIVFCFWSKAALPMPPRVFFRPWRCSVELRVVTVIKISRVGASAWRVSAAATAFSREP
jgi:hypothetical protein